MSFVPATSRNDSQKLISCQAVIHFTQEFNETGRSSNRTINVYCKYCNFQTYAVIYCRLSIVQYALCVEFKHDVVNIATR